MVRRAVGGVCQPLPSWRRRALTRNCFRGRVCWQVGGHVGWHLVRDRVVSPARQPSAVGHRVAVVTPTPTQSLQTKTHSKPCCPNKKIHLDSKLQDTTTQRPTEDGGWGSPPDLGWWWCHELLGKLVGHVEGAWADVGGSAPPTIHGRS